MNPRRLSIAPSNASSTFRPRAFEALREGRRYLPDHLGDAGQNRFGHSCIRSDQMAAIWQQFSTELSAAVQRAAKSIVAIDGRSGHTSSGIVWHRNSILTAAHAIRHEAGIGVILAPGR